MSAIVIDMNHTVVRTVLPALFQAMEKSPQIAAAAPCEPDRRDRPVCKIQRQTVVTEPLEPRQFGPALKKGVAEKLKTEYGRSTKSTRFYIRL